MEDICPCGKPATHKTLRPFEEDINLCCKCHIAAGGIPADWHNECMKIITTSKPSLADEE